MRHAISALGAAAEPFGVFRLLGRPELVIWSWRGLPFASACAAGRGVEFCGGGGSVSASTAGIRRRAGWAGRSATPRGLACYTAIGVFTHPEW